VETADTVVAALYVDNTNDIIRAWINNVEVELSSDAFTRDPATSFFAIAGIKQSVDDNGMAGTDISVKFRATAAEFTTNLPKGVMDIEDTTVTWDPVDSTVVFASEPIATDTGYAAMSTITNNGAGDNTLASSGTGQKICQTEPAITVADVVRKRVVEFSYTAAQFAAANTATNFFYIGNPSEGQYEQISPASAALQAGSVVGLVTNFTTGDVDVYVDGVFSSTVNAAAIETNTDAHVGFTTNGTCSVDCITNGASMTYVDSYGKRLDDWEGNTLT
jgi:hypothetical protein